METSRIGLIENAFVSHLRYIKEKMLTENMPVVTIPYKPKTDDDVTLTEVDKNLSIKTLDFHITWYNNYLGRWYSITCEGHEVYRGYLARTNEDIKGTGNDPQI